jgi:hypothetical protein
VQAWIPLVLAPQWPTGPSLDTGWLKAVGCVRAGLTITDVERQLTVSAARIAASQPATRDNAAPRVRAYGFGPDDATIQMFALMIAMLALPLIVLAISCANVANLHLRQRTHPDFPLRRLVRCALLTMAHGGGYNEGSSFHTVGL